MNVFSQKQDLVSAIMDYKDRKLETAKSAIDNATVKLNDGKTLKPKRLSDYYYYKGEIYLAIFESTYFSDDIENDFTLLDAASNAFLNDLASSGSNSKDSRKKIERCASLYQDAGYKDYEMEQYISSEENFAKAISINMSSYINIVDTLNMFYAAEIAFRAEDYEKAISWSTKLVEINSYDVRYHLRLISSYEDSGDLDGQLVAIKNARSALPQSKDIILEEVNYYISIGNNELLLNSLDEAVSSDPENSILHFVLGSTYSGLGDFDKAKLSYETALSLDPNYVDACNNLAAIYLDEANIYIEKKNKLPINASQKKYNSLTNEIKNLRLKAVPYLERVLLLEPTDLVIIETLKQIYYQLEMDQKSISMKKLLDLPDELKPDFVTEYFSN